VGGDEKVVIFGEGLAFEVRVSRLKECVKVVVEIFDAAFGGEVGAASGHEF
jgi:hypothetical protein